MTIPRIIFMLAAFAAAVARAQSPPGGRPRLNRRAAAVNIHVRVLVLIFCLLTGRPAPALAEPPGSQPDLTPPQLKAVHWQYVDERFQDVYVDGSGRAWFLICPGLDQMSATSPVCLVSPEAPGSAIEPLGTSVLLGFDGQDRFWEITKYGLACTDTRTDKFGQALVHPRREGVVVPGPGPGGGHKPARAE